MNNPLSTNIQSSSSASHSVGLESLDNDHLRLFELIEAASQLSQQDSNHSELLLVLQELADYMDSHFNREHAVLLAINYPTHDEHVEKHHRLSQLVKHAIVTLQSNSDDAPTIISHVKAEFIEIIALDHQIAQFITGHEKAIEAALMSVGNFEQKGRNKIFIVDDDIQQAQLMHEMAKTADLESTVFTASTEFLKTTLSSFDIVVLDLQMPEKDGIEIMRELAAKNCNPNFILVSGFDERVLHSAKQLAESKQLNVIATLTKPIKARDFIALLKQYHQQYRIKFLQQQIRKTTREYSATTETESIHSKDDHKITVEELKLAIRKHQLIIHFQPQICFTRRQLVGAEILLRWLHPTKGLILPEQFIPLAEEHQLMNLMTEEVLRIAIKEYQQLTASNVNIKVSINLSAQNISDLSMPEKLEALVKYHKINPESFVLEITESALMNEISESLDILNRLRMKGFSLSIDDFGTGYSSLVKLYQAPFTELKIDQHFITRMTNDPDAMAIVRICILLAKELKMKTVAEGVETEETWDELVTLGCNIAQGHYIAKPMATTAFIHWVNNWPNP